MEDRLTPKNKKLMMDTYEAMLLTDIDSGSVLSAAKGERKDLYVIDVRDARSYADGHIPGAVNIPASEIEMKFRSVPRDKTVVVYCSSMDCMLAPKAAIKLAQLEIYPKIMRTGWNEWVASKRPVERKEIGGPR